MYIACKLYTAKVLIYIRMHESDQHTVVEGNEYTFRGSTSVKINFAPF